jgi:hypothetical protein
MTNGKTDMKLTQKLLLKGLGLLVFGLPLVVLMGCASVSREEVRREACIDDPQSPWKIRHGSIGGALETDYLTHDTMTIWISVLNQTEGASFKVLTEFKDVGENITYSPSHITVKLGGGEVLRGKGLSCVDAKETGQQRIPPETIPVSKGACYYLVLDRPSPPIEDEVVVYMNDSLRQNGNKIDVPPISFRKTVERKGRLGLFQ